MKSAPSSARLTITTRSAMRRSREMSIAPVMISANVAKPFLRPRRAEIITGALDISRLRRIALRVVMVERALDGADFIEVFRGFLDAGQTEVESYRSAARVFRGGDVRGGQCFTKEARTWRGS